MREDQRTGRCESPVPAAVEAHRVALLLESSNPSMLRAIATARKIASFEMPVLLTGETGTGKRVLAGAIHDWSPRRAGPFVSVSGREPEKVRRDATESPLDPAHVGDEERWAHSAPYGTLFLDDVGMLSTGAQAKLIQLLDEDCPADPAIKQRATASTRVIAATSRDLERDVHAGRFRRELFFRLNGVTIHLPPLRERREDIPHLTASILTNVCDRHHRDPLQLSPDVCSLLAAYDWRGNLRELEMVLEHAVVLARTDVIQLTDLPQRVLASSS